VSYEDRDSAGVVMYAYSQAPVGLLIYDATGHMAVQLMKPPPPKVVSDDWDRFTAEKRVSLFDGTAPTSADTRWNLRARS
jgi:hypothetical protein